MTSPHPYDGEQIQDLLDRRLDDRERAEMESHLESCPECRVVFESLREAREAVARHAGSRELPGGLEDEIRARLDREDAGRPGVSWPRLGWIAAGLVLLAISAWLLLPR